MTQQPPIDDGTPTSRAGHSVATIGYGLLATAVGIALVIPIHPIPFGEFVIRMDFIGIYLGARLLVTGQAAHLYDIATQHDVLGQLTALYPQSWLPLYFIYPAWTAMLLAPLALLGPSAAFLVLLAGNVAASGRSLTWLIPATASRHGNRRVLWLATATFAPLIQALRQGQLSPLLVLALSGALLALRHGRERLAGLWLLLGMLKPTLLIGALLALLAMRKWRTLAIFAGGAALIAVASLAVAGDWPPAYQSFLATYRASTAGDARFAPAMLNAYGLLIGAFGSGTETDILFLGVGVVVAGSILMLCWPRPQAQGPGWEVRLAVAILLGLLINPHLYSHDVAPALLPGLILWGAAQHRDRRCQLLAAGLAAGPPLTLLALLVNPRFGAWYLVALLPLIAIAWPALEPNRSPHPA